MSASGRTFAVATLWAVVALACSGTSGPPPVRTDASGTPSSLGSPSPVSPGLETIDHLVFIVQENRSFDHYFGTFPGADGLEFVTIGAPLDGQYEPPSWG